MSDDGGWTDAEWIRARLELTGRTQRSLAAALGIDASGVSRLLDGSRNLKAAEVPLLRAFFGEGGPDTPPAARVDGRERKSHAREAPRAAVQLLPVYGLLPGEPRSLSFRVATPRVVEHRQRPCILSAVPDAYALYIPNDRLAPRLRAGEVVYVHPGRPPVPGVDVVVRLVGMDILAIGQYLGPGDRGVRLGIPGRTGPDEGYGSPDATVATIPTDEISDIGRIVAITVE